MPAASGAAPRPRLRVGAAGGGRPPLGRRPEAVMFPSRFRYEAPQSLDEAISLLRDGGDYVKVLAGGQSLVPMMKLRFASPEMLVYLNKVPGLAYHRAHTAPPPPQHPRPQPPRAPPPAPRAPPGGQPAHRRPLPPRRPGVFRPAQ